MKQKISMQKIRRKKQLIRLALWTFGWTLTMAAASFGHKYLWEGNTLIIAISVLLNLAIGIGMIFSNRSLINDFDELEKKIQLESMALTLGLTVVVGLSYSLLDITNLISGDAEIGILVLFVGVTYIVTSIVNTRRYR
jgi:hypothetical protein